MIEFTEAEMQTIRNALAAVQVAGPLDALREHVAICDSIIAKLKGAEPCQQPPSN